MDPTSIRVLLIEDNPDYAVLVQQWLLTASKDQKFELSWADSLADGLNRLGQGNLDAVLLDLELPDSTGMATFFAIKSRAPGVATIILSAADSEALAIEMVQQGAEDYLVKSSCNADALVKALRFAVVRHRSQARNGDQQRTSPTRFVGVLGAKGGVGATTLACMFASELQRHTKQKVLLMDLALPAGFASFLTAVSPKFSMLDAATNLHRLDSACWDSIVSHSGEDLHVIPLSTQLSTDVPAEDVNRVVGVVQSFYPWIVLDFGHLSSLFLTLAERLNEIMIVTSPTIPSLFGCKRTIEEMVQAGIEREQLRLIVNQAENIPTLSGGELNTVFGIPVFARLPHDASELHNACVQRRLPAESSDIGKQVAALVRRIAGQGEDESAWKLPTLLSFMGRFRKTAGDTLRVG